LRVWLFD